MHSGLGGAVSGLSVEELLQRILNEWIVLRNVREQSTVGDHATAGNFVAGGTIC